jgi:hypothetical protein
MTIHLSTRLILMYVFTSALLVAPFVINCFYEDNKGFKGSRALILYVPVLVIITLVWV